MTPPEHLKPRVIIVDDARSTRRFLRGVLDESGHFEVVGEAENGAIAVELMSTLQPDVVLLDLSMPDGEGAAALPRIQRASPGVIVIVLSGRREAEAAPLLAQGARAFVQKGLPPDKLIARLRQILGDPSATSGARGPARAASAPPSSPSSSSPSSPAGRPPPAPQPPSARPPITLDGFTAVVCDDDPTARRLIGQVLGTCGVAVVADTDTVPELIPAVQVAQPDLVVLDLWLEHTTGLTALPELQSVSPRSKLVVYSGRSEWRDRAMAGGATDFVEKPNVEGLKFAVHRALDRVAPR